MSISTSTSIRRSSLVAASQIDPNDSTFSVDIDYNQLPQQKLDSIIEICLKQMILYYKGEKTHMYELAESIKKGIDKDLAELENNNKELQAISVDAEGGEKRVDGSTWHVICGSSFGSYVSHQQKNIVLFRIGGISFLIFKHC